MPEDPFLYPVLYLVAIGLGLGKLVRDHGQVDGVSYVAFLAPGLLAATAMQIGTNEAMFPVMAGTKWLKTYVAMLATPLEVGDVVIAVLAWIVTRVAIASGVFVVIMAAFGLMSSWWGGLALGAAVLTGAAFAAPVAAFSATREADQAFVVLYRFGVIPLFLFSGTFFRCRRFPDGSRHSRSGRPSTTGSRCAEASYWAGSTRAPRCSAPRISPCSRSEE